MKVPRRNLHLGDVYLSVFGNENRMCEAVIYFHGFPGPTLDNPVVSLAEMFAEDLCGNRTLYSPRYSGLAESNGNYSFLSSIYDGMTVLFHVLSKGYSKVSIVGYSWGGAVALNCFGQIPTRTQGSLVLLVPVTQFPKNDAAKAMAKSLFHDVPLSLRSQTPESVVSDWEIIDAEFNPLAVAQRIPAYKICIIQGARDEVVPKSLTDEFVASLGMGSQYRVFDEAHSFENKAVLREAVKNVLDA